MKQGGVDGLENRVTLCELTKSLLAGAVLL